jgi:hypothetical protein
LHSPSVCNILNLGKGSSPGARARSDARKASINRAKGAKSKSGGSSFAEAWTQNPSKRSRPVATNRLAQQFQTGPAEGGNGLFGRFSARPTPDPSNAGCASGPRSITVLSGQCNSDSSTKSTKLTAYDGFQAKLTDKSENHLTAKHGHQFGVDDPLPPDPNQNTNRLELELTMIIMIIKRKFVMKSRILCQIQKVIFIPT